jgi:hypothetical protein
MWLQEIFITSQNKENLNRVLSRDTNAGHGHTVTVTVILFKCPKNKRPRGLPLDIRLSRLHLELPYMQRGGETTLISTMTVFFFSQ